MSETMRVESDFLGPVSLPAAALHGVQTARAVENFPISGLPIGHFPQLLRALALVKLAALEANRELGLIADWKAEAIRAACLRVAEGEVPHAFPIDVFQGGAGTSTNMNMNEVVANLALRELGEPAGRYDLIHPNNDVNLSQSTNDVYPTAVRLAILFSSGALRAALDRLATTFEGKAAAFAKVLKLGRTQLQDAVPMTLGQEFQAFAATLREDIARLGEVERLFHEVNLGGTAIGTGINTAPGYQARAVGHLARLSGLPILAAQDLIEACWDTGAFVLYSGMLKRTATKLSKISNDLRLLSSGPRGGLGEISLPPRQPGSSIMPGKVNPVIPEVVNQVAFHVIGADVAITLAAEAGQLQLNAMEPLITYHLLQSLSLMVNAIGVLDEKCVSGITANESQCLRHLEVSTALATALTPVIGYDRAAFLAKEMLRTGKGIRDLVGETTDLRPEEIDLLLNEERLTRPQGVPSPVAS